MRQTSHLGGLLSVPKIYHLPSDTLPSDRNGLTLTAYKSHLPLPSRDIKAIDAYKEHIHGFVKTRKHRCIDDSDDRTPNDRPQRAWLLLLHVSLKEKLERGHGSRVDGA